MPPAVPSTELIAAPLVAHTEASGNASVPVIRKRDRVVVTVTIGVARIERQVTALQNARAGQMFFVKTDDGEVIAARAEPAS